MAESYHLEIEADQSLTLFLHSEMYNLIQLAHHCKLNVLSTDQKMKPHAYSVLLHYACAGGPDDRNLHLLLHRRDSLRHHDQPGVGADGQQLPARTRGPRAAKEIKVSPSCPS